MTMSKGNKFFTDPKNPKCSQCGKPFNSLKEIQEHKYEVHSL